MIKHILIVILMNIAVISGIMYSFQYSAFYGFGLVLVIPAFTYLIKKPYKKEKIVDCYNLNGELIASFKDEFYLKAMLNNRQINFAKDEFFYSNDLKFKQSD